MTQDYKHPDYLVETEWFADHLDDPSVHGSAGIFKMRNIEEFPKLK